MEINENDQKRWKEKLIEILSFFIKYCDSNQLRYYCCGGTAIGAVRHNGFIPWDDDIDVYMPRPDYEKFLNEFNDQNYEIMSYNNSSRYCYSFAKLCDKKSSLIELDTQPYVEGLYIDIFPLDGASNNFCNFKINKTIYAILQRILIAKTTPVSLKMMWKACRQGYYYALTILPFYVIKPFLARKYLNYMFSRIETKYNYDQCDNIAIYTGSYGLKEYIPKSWIGEGYNVKFENLEVKIPQEYDFYLQHFYGDYMKLPPIEKRKSHHFATYYNLEERVSMDFVEKFLTSNGK